MCCFSLEKVFVIRVNAEIIGSTADPRLWIVKQKVHHFNLVSVQSVVLYSQALTITCTFAFTCREALFLLVGGSISYTLLSNTACFIVAQPTDSSYKSYIEHHTVSHGYPAVLLEGIEMKQSSFV